MYQIKRNGQGHFFDYNIPQDPEEDIFKWCERKSSEIVKTLGRGHRETVYHNAFEVELKCNHIPYEKEVVIPIQYKGYQIGFGRADIIVNKQMILEFKAVNKTLGTQEVQQLKKYMEFTGISKGMLINFGKSNHVNGLGIDFIYCNKNDYIRPSEK